jgi:hypothetical protein
MSKFKAGKDTDLPESKEEFKLPKWKKIIGDEHIVSNWDMQYDLLAVEEYINNMIALGWKPTRISGGTQFYFIPCEPGEYICRTVFAVGKRGSFDKQKAAELSDFFMADGAKIVLQEKTMGTQIGLIVLRASSLGPFEVTSDLDSRIAEYEARKRYGEGLGIVFLAIGISQIASFSSMDIVGGGVALGVVWFVLAFNYYRPVPRCKKILERLRSERDLSET